MGVSEKINIITLNQARTDGGKEQEKGRMKTYEQETQLETWPLTILCFLVRSKYGDKHSHKKIFVNYSQV